MPETQPNAACGFSDDVQAMIGNTWLPVPKAALPPAASPAVA